MADQNLLIRMVLDANQYDKGLANAQKSVQGFIQQNMTLGGVLGNAGKLLGAFGAAVGVAGGALEAARKTIAATQTLTDEFGRSVQSATAAVDSMFYALATGSFDGFISGLKDTVKYAREAYDALDDLGTFNIFAGAQGAEIKQQRENLKQEIKTGYTYGVNADGSVSKVKLTQAQIEGKKEELRKVQTEYIKLINQTVEKEENAYNKLAASALKTNLFAGGRAEIDAAVDYYLANYNNYSQVTEELKDLEAKIAKGTRQELQYNQKSGARELTNVYDATALKILNSDKYAQLKAMYQLGDEKLTQMMQHRIAAAMSSATLSAEIRGDERILGGKTAGGGKAAKADTKLSGQEAWMLYQGESALSALETPWEDYEDVVVAAVDNSRENFEKWMEQLRSDSEEMSSLLGGVAGAFNALGAVVGGTTGDNIKAIGQFVEAAGGMVPVIESLIATKKLEEIQANSNATANVAEAATAAGKSVANVPLAGPALAIAAITSVLGMVGAIKAVKFAEGGVVGGNNYTDGIQARISTGEVVLNSHDAKNLYDQIHSGRIGGGGGGSWVSGEHIYIGLSNYLKASGKGQLVIK